MSSSSVKWHELLSGHCCVTDNDAIVILMSWMGVVMQVMNIDEHQCVVVVQMLLSV